MTVEVQAAAAACGHALQHSLTPTYGLVLRNNAFDIVDFIPLAHHHLVGASASVAVSMVIPNLAHDCA